MKALSPDSSPSSTSSEEGDQSNIRSQSSRRRHKRRHHRKKSASNEKRPDVPPLPDLSPEENEHYLAMDCEMVGVGPDGIMSALARVTLLDWDGNVILDTFVRPEEVVTDYRTFVSGITADDLLVRSEHVMDFKSCRNLVLSYIKGKIVIGHGLKNDFHALQIYSHPWYLQRDTAKYEPFLQKEDAVDAATHNHHLDSRRHKARKLKELVYEKLHRIIQPIGRVHDPMEDAMGALDLYKLVRVKWEKCMTYKIEKTNQILSEQYLQQRLARLADITTSYRSVSQRLCVGC
jgi:RNA exonuclease 4